MSALPYAPTDPATGSNRLPALAGEIEAAHRRCKAGVRDALDAALAAGTALIEAKELVPHGQWQDWLKANVPEVSVRTAQRYMRAAENAGKNDSVSFLSLRELVRPEKRDKAPEPDWWWRRAAPEALDEHWRKWPGDIPAAATALREDGARVDAIAGELRIPAEQLRRALAEEMPDRPRFSHSPPGHPQDHAYWKEDFEWGEKFDRLFGLAFRRFWIMHRSGAYSRAHSYAFSAGKPALAERLWDRSQGLHDDHRRLHDETVALEPDPTTRVVAGMLAYDAWFARPSPAWKLDHLTVGGSVNDFLSLAEEERRREALISALETDFPAGLAIEDIARPLAKRAKAAEVFLAVYQRAVSEEALATGSARA